MHRVWWDVRKGNGAEEVKKKKKKRKAALIREQQLQEEGEGIFCSLAFDGGASKKRDYSWNSRVSYSDFLIAKIMTWPRRFLSPRCIRGRISFEREHEREEGGWGVCFVGEAVETIFRTSGGLVEEDPVSREMSRGSWKNSCEIPTKYIYMEKGGRRRRRMIAWRMRARSWTGHGVTFEEIDADNEIMHDSDCENNVRRLGTIIDPSFARNVSLSTNINIEWSMRARIFSCVSFKEEMEIYRKS